MHKCQGTIVLGIPQIEMEIGKIKGESISRKVDLGTEWNHIEAALAHCMGHPVLIIHHNSVQRGIFDRGASNSFLHSVDMCDPLWSICDGISGAIQNWKEELKQIPLTTKQTIVSGEKPTLRWGAYKFDGMEGLYCPACYHKSNLKIPVSRLNTKFHQCPSCNAKLS